MWALPEGVGAIADGYLREIDRALPGRIQGLYLEGSIALADYRPGTASAGGCTAPACTGAGTCWTS